MSVEKEAPNCTCGAGMVGLGAHGVSCEWAQWRIRQNQLVYEREAAEIISQMVEDVGHGGDVISSVASSLRYRDAKAGAK